MRERPPVRRPLRSRYASKGTSTQEADAVDGTVAVKPIDGDGMHITAGSAGDSLFVDHVRADTDPRNDVGPHVRRGGEAVAVFVAHVVPPPHDDVAVGVLDYNILGVAPNKSLYILGVVGANLAFDRIVHPLKVYYAARRRQAPRSINHSMTSDDGAARSGRARPLRLSRDALDDLARLLLLRLQGDVRLRNHAY